MSGPLCAVADLIVPSIRPGVALGAAPLSTKLAVGRLRKVGVNASCRLGRDPYSRQRGCVLHLNAPPKAREMLNSTYSTVMPCLPTSSPMWRNAGSVT
jgi:hypothetical protein